LGYPEPGTYYKVIYRDSIRIVFEAPGLARICENIPGEEILDLLDILEPGDIWEIAAQGHRIRVWKQTTFLLFLTSSAIFAQQLILILPADMLQVNTPYRLVK
jgi:hypothetical protein